MKFILIYLLVIIIHAIIRIKLYPLYFDLKPVDRVKKGYLKFNENYTYQQSVWEIKDGVDLSRTLTIQYRIDIQLKGLYRALFKKLDFKTELRKLNKHIQDINGIDYLAYSKAKKAGKIFF